MNLEKNGLFLTNTFYIQCGTRRRSVLVPYRFPITTTMFYATQPPPFTDDTTPPTPPAQKIVPTTRWAPLPPCPLTDTNYKMNCLIFQAYSNYNSSMLIRGIMRRISSRSVRRITTTTSCPKSKKCIGTNVLVSKT